MAGLGAVICCSVQDKDFVRRCVQEIGQCVDEVVCVICDRRHDGAEYSQSDQDSLMNELEGVNLRVVPYINSIGARYHIRFWLSAMRWLGMKALSSSVDWVFFLDADEIVDSKRMREWLHSKMYQQYDAMALESYWYLREASYQRCHTEYAGTLVNRSQIVLPVCFTKRDRHAFHKGNVVKQVLSLDGKPMVHHYSWVRSKEQILDKTAAWWHMTERNWTDLIEEEWSRPFDVNGDAVYGHRYREVIPFDYIEDDREEIPLSAQGRVLHIVDEEVLAIAKTLPWWVKLRMRLW